MTTATAGVLKMSLYFECRNSANLFSTPIGLKTYYICTNNVQYEKKIRKISHCCSRSPKCVELGHFTLFCRGRLRNVQRFKTHVHSYCSAH